MVACVALQLPSPPRNPSRTMYFGSLHVFDFLIILGYLAVVVYIGRRASGAASSEEGFFLAGRKLGKAYQFFLNFGNATDANGAVSTSSLVYQKGASGVWLSLQTLFMNPYYWFMNPWFRRVRLVTVADLFEDRFGSRALARFYAIFQIVATVIVIIGFGNLVGYKVTASLLVKPEVQWTAAERASVDGYQELKRLEALQTAGAIEAGQIERLDVLREQNTRGELRSYVSWIHGPAGKWTYYIIYSLIVGGYIVMGGLAAAAINEALQGILIVIFSFMLIPFGLAAIGGWDAMAERVPSDMFDLLGGGAGGIGGWELAGIFLISIVQIHGIIGNMAVSGSAKNEFAARFGAVSGTYAKRVMIIMWAFCGLIAVALYNGADTLSDPDSAWGSMALLLLKPGFLGLMMAGLLAANMSTIAAQTMAVSALFVRNVYNYLIPKATERGNVLAGRLAIVGILGCGVYAAANMDDVYEVVQLLLTVNVPFGAAVMLIYFWRRLTAKAVWATVIVSATLNIVFPSFIAPKLESMTRSPALTQRVEQNGRSEPVFFQNVVREDAKDLSSPLVGSKRFHIELWVLDKVGVPVAEFTPSGRNAARFIYDGLFPFAVLILVSFFTRTPDRARTDFFFGKMKTPVGATPELEIAAMEETKRNPHRFDGTKLLGANSSWEFAKWDKVDAIGFIACLGVSGGILAGFWLLLRAAAG
jgi:solute:Na+ symporter, SSS family